MYESKSSCREKSTFSFAQPNAKLYISRNFFAKLQEAKIIFSSNSIILDCMLIKPTMKQLTAITAATHVTKNSQVIENIFVMRELKTFVFLILQRDI